MGLPRRLERLVRFAGAPPQDRQGLLFMSFRHVLAAVLAIGTTHCGEISPDRARPTVKCRNPAPVLELQNCATANAVVDGYMVTLCDGLDHRD